MKRIFLNLKSGFAVLALSLIGFSANASQPAWICAMNFEGQSKGVQVIVGHFSTTATGSIECVGLDGAKYQKNVNIKMGMGPIAPAFGVGEFSFKGVSLGISLFNCHPDALLGNYVVVKGHGSAVIGAGAFVAAKVDLPQIAVQVATELTHGFGVEVGVRRMKITAAD